MLQKGKKILLFPVETVVRELDFRLILAVLCARPGWQILVGEHEHLFRLSLRLRNIVQVLKNVTGGKRPWKYRRYKELGHRIIQLDEEGGLFEGDKDVWRRQLSNRLDVTQLMADDYVCTWGRFQADHYRSLQPACADHIIATGHPRLELGGPRFRELFKQEADALRAKHGPFILINTNLLSNNARGKDVLLRWHKVDPHNSGLRSRLIEQIAFETLREGHFIHLINHLSNAFPGHRIVLRPHPSEDIRTYQSLFAYIPRTEVTREGSLHAWLLACEVLVHGGCTTGIEAYLCGTPIVNFRPVEDARFEIALPNLIGASCGNVDEVATAIRTIMETGVSPDLDAADMNELQESLINFRADTDAFELLSVVISRCQDEAPQTAYVAGRPLLFRRRLRDWLGRLTRPSRHLRRIFHSKDRGMEKFPPLDRAEIKRKFDVIRGITGKPVKLTFHSPKIFSITLD